MEEQQPVIVKYILDRVKKKNKNFLALFVGPTGSGKSLASLKLAEKLDPTFDISRVSFKARDFMNTINDLVARSEAGENIVGRVLVWDEFGVSHNAREFMTKTNRVINYFFQTSRHLNLIVLMTVPMLSFIDSATRKLIHAVCELRGINQRKKTANVNIKMVQANVTSGKEFHKYLRYTKDNKSFVLKKINFGLPSTPLLEAYELKKKAFTTQLNKEIMAMLSKEEETTPRRKGLTPAQERAAELLSKHSVKETAVELNIAESSVYAFKTNIEKKGYTFKPIIEDRRVIRYEIEGFSPISNVNREGSQI